MTTLDATEALAILQLVTKADTLATRRDAAEYAALFTEDAVMNGDMGDVAGREALVEAVARVWDQEPAGTLHLTCNAVIDESTSTPVVASVLVMLIPGTGGVSVQTADVVQHVRHAAAGWKISSRQITIRLRTPAVAEQ